MKVQSWMTKGFLGIPPSMTIGEAMVKLLRHNLHGTPVVDASGELVGIVTLSDIRHRLLPSQQELAEREDYLSVPERMEDRFLEVMKLPVSEIMHRKPITVGPEENVLKAGALMNARHIKQLPVVEDGRVVGLLTPLDIAWGLFLKYGSQG